MHIAQTDFIDQTRRAAGNARHWLDQVNTYGFRPHMHGKDNTAAFVAHYEKQLADCEAILAHA